MLCNKSCPFSLTFILSRTRESDESSQVLSKTSPTWPEGENRQETLPHAVSTWLSREGPEFPQALCSEQPVGVSVTHCSHPPCFLQHQKPAAGKGLPAYSLPRLHHPPGPGMLWGCPGPDFLGGGRRGILGSESNLGGKRE